MKILHTSDWHLGRGLHGFTLYEAQDRAVHHIVDKAIEEKVSAFIIAGDVYDRQIPPTESIKLLNDALNRLDQAGITTIITAGNHDSAERIAAYSSLLRENVRVAGSFEDITNPVELEDEHGKVLIYPLTYLHPEIACTGLVEEGQEPLNKSHAAVVGEAMKKVLGHLSEVKMNEKKPVRSIVVAHAFVGTYATDSKRTETQDGLEESGLIVSESERDLSIGGIQVVPADLFDGITYVALGHLHGAQKVKANKAKDVQLRYSGSLLRYSMSERNHKKSFTIIELAGSETIQDEQIVTHPIPQPRGMARIADNIENLLGEKYATNKHDFVEITITDKTFQDTKYAKLKEYFPFMVSMQLRPDGKEIRTSTNAKVDARSLDPMAVMGKFFEMASGEELQPKAKAVLQEIYEVARDNLKGSK